MVKAVQATTMLFEVPATEELTGPLYIVVFAACGILLFSFVFGYIFNLCRGLRGTDAIPYYNLFLSQLSISDYQLKPNPRPQEM